MLTVSEAKAYASAVNGWSEEELDERNDHTCLCGGGEYGYMCQCHGCPARGICADTDNRLCSYETPCSS